MCVAFTDVNNACPKDCYSLSSIDQRLDITEGYDIMSFFDKYSGNHQIHVNLEGVEKMTFITKDGTFFYKRMPLGFKNVGATY